MRRLGREFYRQDVVTLAKALLGKTLVISKQDMILRARITETEAYGGATDRAAHSYNNLRTARTEVMFHDGGHVYVYFIYGMHYLFNIVANKEGVPEAVLIRGAVSLDDDSSRLGGPGLLTKGLGIDKSFYGLDLTKSDTIYLTDDGFKIQDIVVTERINIDYAGEDKNRPWRFLIK